MNNFLKKINKSNTLKIIEFPSVIFSKSREIAMAKYDILTALKINDSIPFMTFVDVGSASGEYSYIFKKFHDGEIFSFEPIPKYQKLKSYWTNDLKPIEIVLWNENKVLDFYISEDPRMSSIFREEAEDDTVKVKEVKKVEARRFDSLKIKIEKPALLKIDVEGAEEEVLMGFGKLLKEFDIVIIEFSMDSIKKPSIIINIMENSGFYKFVQKDLREGNIQSNMFFINEKNGEIK